MKWKWFSGALLLAGVIAAQPPLELKGFKGGQPGVSAASFAGRRHSVSRRHMIVQFRQPATPDKLQTLVGRGASILGYVPEYGYAVSVPDRIVLSDLDLQWSGSLAASEKVSEDFGRNISSVTSFAIAVFYSDVAMSEARTIVLQAHLHILENPALLGHDLLISGAPSEFLALARWDEVAYIFPASDDLVKGHPVNACPGALTDQGQVGQAVLKVGNWGPVGASADLQYAFVSETEKLSTEASEAEIVRALSTWSKYVKVSWRLTRDAGAARTVAILFGRLAHGDAYPFDGPGGVIAHTFYPYPASAEPLAGDMHFDDDENWRIGADVDVFSVALHETGHALGLGHSDSPDAVMYPYYHKATDLSAEDIAAIQTLYAAQDGKGPSVPAPLTLTVVNPGSSTSSSMLSLSGSTSGGVDPVVVTWTTDTNVIGTATGKAEWTIDNIPLQPGTNKITVAATDSQHASITRDIAINLVNSPPIDRVPSLAITSPVAAGKYATSVGSVTLTGTASYTEGISKISWTSSSGTSGVAAGTTIWNSGAIALTMTTTLISVTAVGSDGQTTTENIEVDYSPLVPTTPVVPSTPPTNPSTPPTSPGTSSGPPSLTILDPAVTTLTISTAVLTISGTASSGLGIASVTWTTSNGDNGTASGTTQWNISGIPLFVGTNTVTIRAYDRNGVSSWRSLVVTRSSTD